MDELKLSTMLGNAIGTGTAVAVVLLILWRVLSRIAERWITALDGLGKDVRDHTTKDLEHHAIVKESIVRVEATLVSAARERATKDFDQQATREAIMRVETKLDSALDWRDRSVPVVVDSGDEAPRGDGGSEGHRRRERERAATNPRGFRPPRAGGHHDPSE